MSGPASVQAGRKPVSKQSAAQTWLPTIALNIVLPTVTFFVLTQTAHLGEVAALILSGIWPLVEIAVTVARQRHVDEFSVFVLIGIVVAVVTAVFSDSARAVFLKDSLTSGLIGLAFLATLVVGRPLTFYLGRRFATDGSKAQRDWWDGLWRHPQFRRVQRQLGAAWGLALLGEAAVRAVLTATLGVAPMVAVNNTVPYLVTAVMIFVSIAVGRRAQATAARRGATTATPPQARAGAGAGG